MQISPHLLDGVDPDAVTFRAARINRAIVGLGGFNSLAISDEESFPNPGTTETRRTGEVNWVHHTSDDGKWKVTENKADNLSNFRNGKLTIAGGGFVDVDNPSPTQRATNLGQAIKSASEAISYHNVESVIKARPAEISAMHFFGDISIPSIAAIATLYGISEHDIVPPLVVAMLVASSLGTLTLPGLFDKKILTDPSLTARPFRATAAKLLLKTTLVRAQPQASQL